MRSSCTCIELVVTTTCSDLSREVDGAGDFEEGGDTGKCFNDAVLRHGEITLLRDESGDFVVGRIITKKRCQLIIHEDCFEESNAAFVARLIFIRRQWFPYRFYFFGYQSFVGKVLKDSCNHLFLLVGQRPLLFLIWVKLA